MDMMGRVDLAMTGPVGLPTRARVARPMTVRAGHATMVPEVLDMTAQVAQLMMALVEQLTQGRVDPPTRGQVARPMTARVGRATMVPEVRVTVALGERESFALQYAGEV